MPNKPAKNRIKRPPVVVVMGHIDHGKSTLLDYIRKSNIVAGEAGSITQHVGAYQVEHESKGDGKTHSITFLDTPGHEAFCTIRERGAQAADIAILVVSAEDGVKPQTLDALKAIKTQNIPYIVAINKIDKPNADIDRTKTSLGENEIYVEGWGGDIPCVAVSALNGQGIDELLDMVILVAELADLDTDPTKTAEGVVIESELDTRKGISATLLIKDGTLNVGQFVVAGGAYSPVRFIEDFNTKKIKVATASMPVTIVGWNKVPECGIVFTTADSKKSVERLAGENIESMKKVIPANIKTDKIENGEKEETITLPIIIKADVIGSLDGVRHELEKIKHDKVQLKIVTEDIGEINENDVKIALSNPEMIIVGFNVEPDKKAGPIIERTGVKVKTFKVIYELTNFIKESLLAKVPKEYIEESTGRAKVLVVFSKEKDRQVLGGKVENGTLSSGNEVKITRRESEIGRGKIRELQEKKLRTSEVAEGHEFGMMVEAKVEIAVGDRIEAVRTVEKK